MTPDCSYTGFTHEFVLDAAAALIEDELAGMALVCFPGSQCTQYPAPIVFDALAREIEGIQREEKRAGGSGYLFRLVDLPTKLARFHNGRYRSYQLISALVRLACLAERALSLPGKLT